MSTSAGTRSTSTRPLNVRERLRQRGIDATRHLNDTLRLSGDMSDTKLLGTALAEVVVEESARNPQLASRVRARYDELVNMRGTEGRSSQEDRATSTTCAYPARPAVPRN